MNTKSTNVMQRPALLTKDQIEQAKYLATKQPEYDDLRLQEKRDTEDKAIARAQQDIDVAYYESCLPPKLKCLRCGHEWRPRQEDVRRCPKCNSPYWDKQRKEK